MSMVLKFVISLIASLVLVSRSFSWGGVPSASPHDLASLHVGYGYLKSSYWVQRNHFFACMLHAVVECSNKMFGGFSFRQGVGG
eukprot:1933927-Amphidinium_carterae.3